MASAQQIPATALKNEQQHSHNVHISTQVTLRYFSKQEDAKYYKNNDWSGFIKEYPLVLPKDGSSVTFVHHDNTTPGGNSKAGVAYSAGERYWLLAWNQRSNQVYVKVAEKGPIDWNIIEKELDASSSTSVAVDPVTGVTIAMASIANANISTGFYNL